MVLGKAPGQDGFTMNFFHFFWDLIKEEVLDIIEESRSKKGVLKNFNATFLALIPKEDGADSPGKFRHISLCNVIYKIISKVIVNRLKPLLPNLISPEQSRFVEGRQILDGVILVHEVIHSLKITKKPNMLIKLNMSKKFDKLSWEYIKKMLLSYGFNTTWTDWILFLTSKIRRNNER